MHLQVQEQVLQAQKTGIYDKSEYDMLSKEHEKSWTMIAMMSKWDLVTL